MAENISNELLDLFNAEATVNPDELDALDRKALYENSI